MKKHVKVIQANLAVLEFFGTDFQFAEENGYTENEVERSYTGALYLKGYAPKKPLNEIAQEARSKRDGLLSACDWTQMADCPLSSEQKLAWATYRQALRDVPEQTSFPTEILWPEVPNV